MNLAARLAFVCALVASAPTQAARADELKGGEQRAEEDIADPAVKSEPLLVAGAPEPPPPTPTSDEPPPHDGAGPRLTFGRTLTQGVEDGYFGRFESEYFEARGAAIAGALLGLEGWGGPSGGGGSIPISFFAGARVPFFNGPKAPSFIATVGAGFDIVTYESLEGDGGFGIFAPFATGVLGFEVFPGARLLGDARVEYRWLWGAPDRYQVRLGASIAVNSDWWDGP